MWKKVSKIAILGAVVLIVGAVVGVVSFSNWTAYAAKVGEISISEEELQTEIGSCLMLNEKTVDLEDLAYKIASTKVMRERIKGTEYDLPADYEKELYQDCEEKASDESPEFAEQLANLQLTRQEVAEILYHVSLDGQIQYLYVQMMAPQVISENPDITDGQGLVEKMDEYVEEEVLKEFPAIEFSKQAVDRLTKFAEERHMEIVR